MYKVSAVVVLFVLFFASCGEGNKKQEEEKKDSAEQVLPVTVEARNELAEVITRFVRAYENRDEGKVNKLIHPELGFTVIYRPGVSDTFVKVDSIDFAKAIPEYYPYPSVKNGYALTFATLPEFDCGTEKWTKEGFFCDTTSHPNQLSNIVAFEKEFDQHLFSESQLEELEKSEEESFRVMVTLDVPLVFHVQRYRGNWYVTVLDRAYAGCDA